MPMGPHPFVRCPIPPRSSPYPPSRSPTTDAVGARGRIGSTSTHTREADMADQQAVLKTNRGDITINLFPNHAPETVSNFVGLAEGTKEYRDDAGRSGERYYDGLTFRRVIEGFVIQ